MDTKNLPYLEMTIADVFMRNVFLKGNRMAYQYGNRFWSWNQIHIASEIMADELVTMGVKKGDHVGIWSPNSINYIIAFFAVQKVHAAAVLLNPAYRKEELEEVIAIAGITCLCYGKTGAIADDPKLLDHLVQSSACPLKKVHSIIVEENDYSMRFREYTFLDFEYVSDQSDNIHDTACVLFTSGSTAKPKAVQLSHYNVLNCAEESAQKYYLSEKDNICMALPLFHCFGIVFCVLSAMVTGAVIHITESTRTADVLRVIDQYQCTVFHAVPTLMLAVINNRSFGEYRTSQIRASVLAGAPVVPAQLQKMAEAFPNDHFMNAYGQTEASPTISMTDYDGALSHVANSIGKPLDRVEVGIMHTSSGEFLPQGQVGEIVARGYNIMSGYMNLPPKQQAVDENGWLHTGDLALCNEEGYLQLRGRAKELIIRGGENISPIEVENAICEYEEILSCKVVGAPHDFLGEEVVACIELKKRNKYCEEKLYEHLRNRLSEYKLPARVIVYESLPMTANGKVDAKRLKEEVKR